MLVDSNPDQFFRDLDRRLWNTADQLRSNLDAAVYKHVVLGLIFLKYVSDAFEERQQELKAAFRNPENDYFLGDADLELIKTELEGRDYYTEKNVFWVPQRARWSFLVEKAKLPPGEPIVLPDGTVPIEPGSVTPKNPDGEPEKFKGLDVLLDRAMQAVEDDNPRLRNVLNKDYARLQLGADKLGRLLDLVASIPFRHATLRSKDILGHVYEYFLGEFASLEGKKGGQYYTPQAIVGLIVEMLEPFQGRVYDPCCGSGGFFVQSERFIEQHAGQKHYNAEEQKRKVAVYGQESNPTTWRLAQMNLVIRNIEARVALGDTLLNDAFTGERFDFVMANPPFNLKDWGAPAVADDRRWEYATPPNANANFAWLQHIAHHLAPTGRAGVLLSNGSMSSNTNGEGDIRRQLVEADLIECMVALPGQLFTNTQIPACVWVLTRSKKAREGRRDRQRETLFIDARNLGFMRDRVRRDFAAADLARVVGTYHRWQRGDGYADEPGFCRSASLGDIAAHDYVLTPGRYVGAEEKERTGDAYEVAMPRLVTQLRGQFAESARLQEVILENFEKMGYGE